MDAPPHTPVIVGQAQLEQRALELALAREPLDLMIDAARAAAEDAGAPQLLARASSVRVIRGIWRYDHPAGALAAAIGAAGAETVGTGYGGNTAQSVVSHAASAILRGELDVVVIAGAEIGHTRSKAKAAGKKVTFRSAPGAPDLVLGSDEAMSHPCEIARGLQRPIEYYPMFENALRAARGESLAAHAERISELWARFSAVAADNPHAWIKRAYSAHEIRTPSASNRMVSFPYPKLMSSNSRVDQAGALLMCSYATARAAGVARERLVFPWAGSDAHDHYYVSHRADLCSSPAIRIAGLRTLELADTTVDELAHVDVYSCFPVAVQVAAAELGLSLDRPLTVTGGLTFGGGPLNSYVLQSIARMVEVLRADPGSRGLITANGGYLTKHAFGVYCSEPPAHAFRHEDLQAEVDRTPRREVIPEHDGEVIVEAYTVMYGDTGPQLAHLSCLLPDGRRTWANAKGRSLLEAMTREEFCGQRVRIAGGALRA
jgi:acetyl-CoA C-acetyltransferase